MLRDARLSGFGLCLVLQRFHVSKSVSLFGVMPTDDLGRVVKNYDTVEFDLYQGLHDFGHVVISVIHEGLDKVWERCAHVAKMNLPDLLRTEVPDHLRGVLVHELRTSFVPAP